MRKRTGKWYSKNEKEVMQKLGLTPTKQSGAGWKEKEDGYNEKILAQLKSTDSDSYRVKLDDLRKLEYNASVEHKTPVFIIDFINQGLYVLCRVDDLEHICDGLEGTSEVIRNKDYIIYNQEEESASEGKEIHLRKGNKKLRDKFMKELEEKRWNRKLK